MKSPEDWWADWNMAFKKPTPEPVPDYSEPDMEPVIAWRVKYLEDHGFEPTVALRLASDKTIDKNAVAGLLLAGCSHKLAADIYG